MFYQGGVRVQSQPNPLLNLVTRYTQDNLEQVLVRNVLHVLHYVPVLRPSHHLQVHKIFHYVPITPPSPPPTNSLLQDILEINSAV
jgi:hypothetical protein